MVKYKLFLLDGFFLVLPILLLFNISVERVHKMHQEQMEKSKIGAHQPNISLSDSLSIGFLQDYVC